MWPDRRLLDLFGLDHPIIQAPMVGQTALLAATVSAAGGLGSLAAATLSPEQLEEEIGRIREVTRNPFNVNFFCHQPPVPDPARDAAWRNRLLPYYRDLGLDPDAPVALAERAPFNDALCAVVEAHRPFVVSFHFGLPEPALVDRVKAAGCRILASATTVAEARWLAERGVDAVIAQGAEAGGHRGMFLTSDVAAQVGTFALVPQIVDAVDVPVIAAGGIADARGVAAALLLGASLAQIGTAYLFSREAKLSPAGRAALAGARDDNTALTNVFTGRPARGVINRALAELGPLSADAPAFPLAARRLQPLRMAAEERGSADFSPVWSGQAAALARENDAASLTRQWADGALSLLSGFSAGR